MVQCIMCKSREINDIKYGKLLTKNKISAHYFCLLLTSNLVQNGNDNEGILGFLLIDIQKEANRISKQICCYCGLKSAGIGCCDLKCRRTFHLICGIENGALNQFSETFRSFCNFHIPKLLRDKLPLITTCSICYDKIDEKFVYTMCCKAPCCKNGWFHKYCLQSFANNSGYFFKCPLCNNKDDFRNILIRKGIFVPDQDAAWELEPNAFSELLERPNECSAFKCLCSKGRKYTNSYNYEIIFCDTCGSQGIHILCNDNGNKFNCNDCSTILSERNTNNSLSEINANTDLKDLIDDIDENEFVVVDDIEEKNKDITAAQAFRNSINNHPLATNYEDFEKNVNITTNITNSNSNSKLFNLKNTEDFVPKSNILQRLDRSRSISDSDDDEIIQLTRRKKRKINSDSDRTYENKSTKKIITRSQSRSQSSDDINLVMHKSNNKHRILVSPIYTNTTDSSNSSPILQLKSRTRKSLKTAIDSSDDTVPLIFFKNKGKDRKLSTEKNENKYINAIITRSHSKSQSSDDINVDMNKQINKYVNTAGSSRISQKLRYKGRGRKSVTKESSNTNINLTQNVETLNEQNDEIKKEINAENNVSNQKCNIEKKLNIPTNRKSRTRSRRVDDKIPIQKKYFTRSKTLTPKSCLCETSCTKSIDKNSTFPQKQSSRHRFPLVRYERENSVSSLSSSDINLKEKNKSLLEDNAKNKQTPINRNIPSSSKTRLKCRSISLKSNDNSLSSSSAICSFIQSVNRIENEPIHHTSSAIPIKNSTIYPHCSNSDLISSESYSETLINSDYSSSNLLSESLHIASDSDSDDFVATVINSINNIKDNNQYKNITKKSKNCININNKNNDKVNNNDIRRYLTPNKFYKNQLHI